VIDRSIHNIRLNHGEIDGLKFSVRKRMSKMPLRLSEELDFQIIYQPNKTMWKRRKFPLPARRQERVTVGLGTKIR
jgi:hypothetical protein